MTTQGYPVMEPHLSTFSTNAAEICAAIIKFALMNPGNTSSHYADKTICFRSIKAKHPNDMVGLATEFSQALKQAVDNNFPDKGFDVSVESYHIKDDKWGLNIKIRDQAGIPVISCDDISFENDQITINFNNK